MGEGLGFLRRQLQAPADRSGRGEVGDEGEDFQVGTAERTGERIHFVDPLDHLRPTKPGLVGEGVDGVHRSWPEARPSLFFSLAPLAPGGIGVPAPVADHLLAGLGDVIDNAGDEFQDIPQVVVDGRREHWKSCVSAPLPQAETESAAPSLWRGRSGGAHINLQTHNMAQARRASDECIFMLLGKVIEHSPTGDMFVTPKHKQTSDYIEGRYG